jgi:hypothetical protein
VKIDRRLFVNFDWILLVIVMAISGLGLLNLYSAGFNLAGSRGEPLYIKQIYWIVVGLILMIAAFSIDYRIIVRHAYTVHAISLLLLFLVFFLGHITHGSQRWLVFYGFSFQPSELVKLTMIIALARFYKDNQIDEGYYLRNALILFFIIMMPFLMIMRQPDLGTSLFLALLFFTMVFFMGMRRNIVIFIAAVSSVLAPLLWFIMKGYQKDRLRLPYYSIDDCHRFGRFLRKGIYERYADAVEISAGTANGFRIFGLCRGMGFPRRVRPDVYFPFAHPVGIQDCTKLEGFARDPDSLRRHHVHFLGGLYQYRHGPRSFSGCGDSPAFLKLWGVFDGHTLDGHRPADEYKYEKVCFTPMIIRK